MIHNYYCFCISPLNFELFRIQNVISKLDPNSAIEIEKATLNDYNKNNSEK